MREIADFNDNAWREDMIRQQRGVFVAGETDAERRSAADMIGRLTKAKGPLDMPAAHARAEDGMTRAIKHAEAVKPSWADRATAALEKWVAIHRDLDGSRFMAENVIAFIHATPDFPHPPTARAWGGIFQKAARAGLIVKVGYAPAASSNGSPKVQWRAS